MKSKYSFFLIFLFTILVVNLNNSSKAETIQGFDARTDLKFGPVMKLGIPLGTANNSNVSYLPSITLDFKGESFIHGTTGFQFNWTSSTRQFVNFESQKTKFSEVSPASNATQITKNLLQLNLVSPIGYTPGSKFEFGWIGGIFSQFVTTDANISGDTSSNIGVNLGGYVKSSHFYPLVPFINGRVIFGNLYDNGKTYQEKTLSSSLKAGYFLNGGFEFYLTKKLLISVNYNMSNPDFFTFSPTKASSALGDVNTQPVDDDYISFQENVQAITGSIGFLF